MATTKRKTTPAAETIPAAPVAETPATTEPAPEALIASPEYKTKLLARFETPDTVIAQLQADYGKLTIAGPDDKETYKTANDALGRVRSLRTGVEAKRKALKQPFWDMGVAIDTEAKRLTLSLQPIEAHLKGEIDRTDREIEERKRAEERRRMELLLAAGFQLAGQWYQIGKVMVAWDKLPELTEEQLTDLCAQGRAEAEAIRLQKEQEEQQRQALAKEREELEALKKLLADKEAELKAKEQPKQQQEPAIWEAEQEPPQWGGCHPGEPAGPMPEFAKAAPAPATQLTGATYHQGETVPVPVTVTPTNPKQAWFNDGWEACKSRIIKVFTEDATPRKRAEWVEIFKNLKP